MHTTSCHVSDAVSAIVSQVDSGSWKRSRVPAYRIISKCETLLGESLELLTDSERQWMTGVLVWVSETLEDAARGEGVYME